MSALTGRPAEAERYLAMTPTPATDRVFGLPVEAAIGQVRARRGRTAAELVVARQLEHARLVAEKLHTYAEACWAAGVAADPVAVLRLLHFCDDTPTPAETKGQ